ncbi:MAG: nucleoside-diphosphate sugar epimerase/dehydratase [Casimicrobiaceae bacterium]
MPVRINIRVWLAFAHDVVAAALAWWLAFIFRLNFDIGPPYSAAMWQTLIWVVPLKAVIFWRFGLYRGLWRFASLTDLQRILGAVVLAGILIPLVLVMFRVQAVVPRSVLLLDPLLLVLIMGGSRFAYRMWREHRLYSLTKAMGEPVVVIGAGEVGERLIRELRSSREWRVVGLLDDDAAKLGSHLHGTRILGRIDELKDWAPRFSVTKAIIALPSANHAVRRRVAQICAQARVQPLTVPSYDDLIGGHVGLGGIRQIEIDDLLGRDPVVLDSAGLRDWLGGQTVMVTGAGGSIGSELCRQIARFSPARIVLFELSEFALYQIELDLQAVFPTLELVGLVGDVKNAARVREVIAQYQPSALFHAAAYKHVPMMEVNNGFEAVRNNALGTLTLAQAAADAGVPKFVLVSTDKAVNPVNIMGASKRLAEMVCQSFTGSPTRFVVVRFGNVLFSAGSVVNRFREQIAKGGPVTVTHPEMTRYFMSIPEAAQLVLQAGLIGDSGQILVLDMGEPVKIVDLARDLIALSGVGAEEVRIVISGLRPGEKLYEEPLADDETTIPTPIPKLRIATARAAPPDFVTTFALWCAEGTARSDEEVRTTLSRWVPEYKTP